MSTRTGPDLTAFWRWMVRRGALPGTAANYRQELRRFLRRHDRVTRASVANYLAAVSPASARQFRKSIRRFAEWSRTPIRLPDHEPCATTRAPVLTPDECDAALMMLGRTEALDLEVAAATWLMLGCGLRPLEVAALHSDAADTDNATVATAGPRRVLCVPTAAWPAVHRWAVAPKAPPADPARMFTAGGRDRAAFAINRMLGTSRAVGAARLRSTHIGMLLSIGVDAEEVQRRVGHAHVRTTEAYLRSIDTHLKRLAARIGLR